MSKVMNAGCVGAVMAIAFGLAAPAHAGNIITFDDASQKCGGAVMCSYDGTTGYLNNGMGKAFNLSTIRQWFQVDVAGKSMLSGQPVEPDKDAGSFLVVNDTGAPITSFSLTVNDDFTTKTASVHNCSGAQKGNICDNFTAHGGNGTTFNTGLTGTDWDRCTQGQTVGQSCTGNSGGVAADFSPGSVAYSWTAQPGKSIAAGATFRVSFSGWNNDAWAAAPRAYITNFEDNTVSVIDTGTNNVIATIGVGTNPDGVSVSPDGSKVYVTNDNSNTVSVIDTASNAVTATIAVGTLPVGLSVAPDGTRVYVANVLDQSVSVIDTASNTVIGTIAIGVDVAGVAVAPDGSHVYVTDDGFKYVSVIDTASNTVSTTIAVGMAPVGVAFAPDGSKAYVANDSTDASISVIDTAANQVIATIGVHSLPYGVAVSPDGSKVYVTNITVNAVSVIDTATDTVTKVIPVGKQPSGVSVTSDGSQVYVANTGSNTVSVIDAATNTVSATIPVGSGPDAFGNFIQP